MNQYKVIYHQREAIEAFLLYANMEDEAIFSSDNKQVVVYLKADNLQEAIEKSRQKEQRLWELMGGLYG